MTCTSTGAPMAHAFDPAAWLAQFETVGGGWILRDCLFRALLVEDRSDEELARARQMIVDLTDEDRASLTAHLRWRRDGGEG
jgi:hypothetical protein